MKSKILTGILAIMLILIAATSASAYTFLTYCRDLDTKNPIPCTATIGDDSRYAAGRDSQASFPIPANTLYYVKYEANGYKWDIDPIFFDEGLYYCEKGKDCHKSIGNFDTFCDWDSADGRWYCTLTDINTQAKIAFVYMGNVNGYFTMGRVNFLNVNYDPALSAIPAQTVQETGRFEYQIQATDRNGDTLSYELQGEPNGMTISNTGLIRWDPGFDDEGTYTIMVYVRDYYSVASTSFDLTVTKRNRAPSITGVSVTQNVHTDEIITCTPAGWNDADGDAAGYDYAWQFDGSAVSGQTAATLDCNTVSGCDKDVEVTCIVTPNDGTDTGASQSDSVTISNTAPSITSASITDPAYTDTIISCTAAGWSDIDGDTAGYDYEWQINSAIVPGQTSSTLDCGSVNGCDKAKTITCRITPDDGTDLGASQSDSVTISNTAPSITSASITDPAYTDTDLTCTPVGWTDADNDNEGYNYVWYKNTAVIAGETTNTLASANFIKGDVVVCEITPDDGTDLGASQSDSVTISNSAPSITGVSVTQNVHTDEIITCTPAGWNDADGDAAGYDYAWQFDGSAVSGQTSNTLDCNTVSGCDKDVEVTCIVTPNDGTDTGAPQSDSTTILNTAPSITSVSITDPAYTDTDVTCTPAGWNDADGDAEGYDYAWYNNDIIITGETANTLASANFVRDDVVKCEVTPNDGDDTGTTLEASVTISNSAPSIDSASITKPAYTDTNLTCTPNGWNDADGDAEGYNYVWFKNSTTIAGETTNTLTSDNFVKDDIIMCEITPDDGTDLGAGKIDFVTISNTPPSITSVSVTDPAYADTGITCTPAGWNDIDGDPEMYEFEYFVNGTSVAITMSDVPVTVTPGASKNDVVTCQVTPFDGDYGIPLNASVTISNTPPSITNVTVTDPAYTDTIINCTPQGWNDTDGDIEGYDYAWQIDSVNVSGETSDSLDCSSVAGCDKNAVITCIATPDDGTDLGTPQSGSVTISNTPPVLTNPSLNNTAPKTDDIILCIKGNYSDADNDPEGLSSFRWFDNSVEIAGETAQTLNLSVAGLDKGDIIYCEQMVSDGTDNSSWYASDNATIQNSAPVMMPGIAPISWPEDTNFTGDLSAYVSDPDNDPLAFTSTDPENISISIVNSTVTLTPELNFYGINYISITAQDPEGLSDTSDPITLNVTPVNDDPVITSTPVTSTLEDSLYTYDVDAADIDLDTLTYSLAVNPDPANMTIDPNTGLVAWTPDNSFVGNNSVTVQVDDGNGGIASQLYTLEVINTNDAPVITTITPPPNATEDMQYSYDFNATDDDIIYGDVLVWSIAPVGSINSSTGVFTWTPAESDVGVNEFTVYVADSAPEQDSFTWNITVINVNDPPTVSDVRISPQNPLTTDNLTCSYNAQDIDSVNLSANITWYIVAGPSFNTDILDSVNTAKNDVIFCNVTVYDDLGASGSNISAPVTIGNSAPSVSNVTITPDPAYDTSTLTGDGNYSDPDNDPSASTFRWFANGVEIPGETSQSLASAYLNAGDIITFEYTPNDGTAAGTPLNASITINLDPAPGITIHSPLPGSVHASSALLNVSTNETADCLYSLNGAANQTLYTAATEGSANAAPLQHGNNTIDVVCSDLFGKSSSESVIFEGDIIAPAAITDLSAAAIDDFSIELTWTAVGDDGVTGTASSYIIKQAYAPITTQAQFDAASTAVGSHLITPAASGSAETFIVTGLVPGSTYHFAVEAVDDVGHVGALGNTDSATPSTHDVSVNSFAHDKPGTTLYVGDSITFTANIGNSGNIAETITVDLAENGAVIDTQTINLTSGANQDVTFNYVLPAESLGTRYSVEASISEVDIDGSNNYMQLFIDTWSIRNNFNLDWVDPSNYPNANEAGATFYAWAKLENTKVYDFNNVTITVNTDGLSINTNQDGTTDNLKTYSPFEGYDINTFWWEINSGSSETRDITVSIGNPGDDITITRSVTFP